MTKDFNYLSPPVDRRRFIQTSIAAGAFLATGSKLSWSSDGQQKSNVFMVKGSSRSEMIPKLLNMFGLQRWKTELTGKKVVLKPNLNSAHPFPGSTHPDTLRTLVGSIKEANPASIHIVDRSGMGNTIGVMKMIGADKIASEFGAELVPYESIDSSSLILEKLEGGHWSRGIEWPRMLAEADCIVQTCCLKTHQYGGHFTLSLKNSVGMISKFASSDNYNYMMELHQSQDQRRMIAEVNSLYQPTLVILDGISCFVDGGPHIGTLKEPGVMLAATDRVALDAVGVAILRSFGTTPQVSAGKIFQQEQIARAVELGLGVASADQVVIETPDSESEEFASNIRNVLSLG